VCALTLLIRNEGPDGEPDPHAMADFLAAGALPALLRITSLSDDAALAAVEFLHVVVCEPRAEAEIAAADCVGPLVTALGVAFRSSLKDVRSKGKADVRAHVVGVIGKLVEGRPVLGQAFLAAGMPAQMPQFLAPDRDVAERKLAMQLAEKLIRHVLGACDAMNAAGVFTSIHQLTFPAPKVGCEQMSETGEGARPRAVLEAEPLQARELLCMAAAKCGGVLEVANGDAEVMLYTANGVITPSPGTSQSDPTPSRQTPDASPPPSPRTPEVAPTRCPGSPEAVTTLSTRTPEAHPPPSPGTPDAASADGGGQQELPQSGRGTPEVAAAQASPHAKVWRPSRRLCAMCGARSEQKLQVCTRCRRAAYCGRECQAAHWPLHKSECRG
jgi:hypothetical protein